MAIARPVSRNLKVAAHRKGEATMSLYSNGQPPPTSAAVPKIVVGKKLSRRRKGISPSHRALLARDLETGRARLCAPLTRKQSLAVTGASNGYTARAAGLTPEERVQVEAGSLSLSSVHNRPPTDAQIDRLIARVGADRIMKGIDRYTSPRFSFAAM
jgi:hypothetical protein